MNIGIVEKYGLFEIGLFLKNSYKNKYINDTLKFITLEEREGIDLLILNTIIDIDLLEKYFDKLKNTSIILVNTDDKDLVNIISRQNFNFITFGFNPKSSITLSSFKIGTLDTSVICIQRDIQTINQTELNEQEFLINSKNISEFDILLTCSVLIVFDFSIDEIKNAFLDFILSDY